MSKILKNISFDLNARSINRAIREIQIFQQQLNETIDQLVEALTEKGVEVAKLQIAAFEAVDTGELEHSIQGYYSPNLHAGWVYTNAYHAMFVEYGTGIVGEGTYPTTTANGWQYDINGHGEYGWIYRKESDGTFHWTNGYVARPFMLNTFEWLKEAAPDIASRMWTQM